MVSTSTLSVTGNNHFGLPCLRWDNAKSTDISSMLLCSNSNDFQRGLDLKNNVFLLGQIFKLGNVIIFIYFSQIIYAYVQTIKGVQGNTGQRLPLSLSNPAPWPRTSCCYWFLRVLAEMANAFKNIYDAIYFTHTGDSQHILFCHYFI